MNDNFSELKERILASARIAQACREQYSRAYSSETAEELMAVVRDNFHWCVANKVLTVSLIEEYKEIFTEYGVHANESVDSGYLLADNATVEACGNAYIASYSTIECSLSDKAIYRIRETNTIRFASDELNFERIYDDRTSE